MPEPKDLMPFSKIFFLNYFDIFIIKITYKNNNSQKNPYKKSKIIIIFLKKAKLKEKI